MRKMYMCDVCGAQFLTIQEAEKCEKAHVKEEKKEIKEIQEMPVMITLQEAADLTRQSYHYMKKLCSEKKIKYVMNGRKYLINKRSLINYFNEETEEA